jgi:uncharacterized repeat protein (TIGR03803 family)
MTNGLDGRIPQAGVVPGADGTLYGATYFGGSNNWGTVFSLNPNGSGHTQLHLFDTNGIDGEVGGGLLYGRDGALYGTTAIGGSNKVGTVFRLNTNGTSYALLHAFLTNGIDGQNGINGPVTTGAIQGMDGALYGTTQVGGTNKAGAVFKLSADGTGYSLLHTFVTNGIDGQRYAAVAQGSDGMLYGTTGNGGSNNAGVVFKLNTNGGAYTLLHTFRTNGVDGVFAAVVLQGSDGMLYGTTYYGGSNGYGTVFKLDVNGGSYTPLHTFNYTEGQTPVGLMQGSDGTLYGTTQYGGRWGSGTIFKLNPDASGFAVVHEFELNSLNQSDGLNPRVGLWQGSDGALYGTTITGGTNNSGAIFRLALNPGRINSSAFLPNKTFQLSITGAALNYRIDASTNLASWATLTNVVNTAGTYHFIDPDAATFPQRFYRVHSSP